MLNFLRCRACDSILTEKELEIVNPNTHEFEDMCTDCLDISLDSVYKDDLTDDK